jgi:3-deoxy-D-manno-octulosonic acid (KDO) 8-phosphate synthase
VHQSPDDALSDGIQSLKPERFALLVAQAKAIASAIGRDLANVKQEPAVPLDGSVSGG